MSTKAVSVPKVRKRTKTAFNPTQVLVALTATLVVFSICYWGANLVKKHFLSSVVSTEACNTGTIKELVDLHAYVIRSEQVVVPTAAGKLKQKVAEGERVRVGSQVAELQVEDLQVGSQTISLNAPSSGIVSFKIDHKENLRIEDNLDKLDLGRLMNSLQAPQQAQVAVNPATSTGVPAFKVIDNLEPIYLLTELAAEHVTKSGYKEGIIIPARLGGNDITFRINKLVPHGNNFYVLLSTSSFRKPLDSVRELDIQLVLKTYSGYIVKESALTQVGGQTGVYVIYKEVVQFEPVKVVGKVDKQAAIIAEPVKDKVSRLVGANVLIVNAPALVKPGQQLKL